MRRRGMPSPVALIFTKPGGNAYVVGILLNELAAPAHPLSGAMHSNDPHQPRAHNEPDVSLHENVSLALFMAGDFGFLTLIQSRDGPDR
jgi:hypothetical protein